jgi:hypothetical protein
MQQVGADSNHLRAQQRRPLCLAALISPDRPGMSISLATSGLRAANCKRATHKAQGYREAEQKLNEGKFAFGPPIFDQGQTTVGQSDRVD